MYSLIIIPESEHFVNPFFAMFIKNLQSKDCLTNNTFLHRSRQTQLVQHKYFIIKTQKSQPIDKHGLCHVFVLVSYWREGSESVRTMRDLKSSLGFRLLFDVLHEFCRNFELIVGIGEIERYNDFVGIVDYLTDKGVDNAFSHDRTLVIYVDCGVTLCGL